MTEPTPFPMGHNLPKPDADGHFTEAQKIDLRVAALEFAVQIATAKGKPGHAPYIAGDLYDFLLSGKRPEVPEQYRQPALRKEKKT